MAIELGQSKLLATTLVNITSPTEIFQNQEFQSVEVTSIKLVNVDAYTPPTITIFHDDDGGSSFSSATQIWQGLLTDMKEIDATNIGGGVALQRGGQLGIELSASVDVSVTIYGAPASRAPRS